MLDPRKVSSSPVSIRQQIIDIQAQLLRSDSSEDKELATALGIATFVAQLQIHYMSKRAVRRMFKGED